MSFQPVGKPYRRIVTRAELDNLLIEEKRNLLAPTVKAYAPMAGDQFRVTLFRVPVPHAYFETKPEKRRK